MYFGNMNGKSASKNKFCTIEKAILTNKMVKKTGAVREEQDSGMRTDFEYEIKRGHAPSQNDLEHALTF